MKKLLILMGILMLTLTLSACNDPETETTPPIFAAVTIEGTNPSDGTVLSTYYKGKRDDLTVGIELVNNSNFIINSIVINGKNYRFTRFTAQSTSTNITFDMSVGSTLAETIYSVDEIIYQDGNTTKSVYVNQNNEFKVYVYKDTPVVERENYETTRESISIDFNVTDIDAVIESGSLIAQLYSGETKITETVLTIGQTNVLFDGLLANRNYVVKVIADYDLDDSLDMNSDVIMYSGAYTTLSNALPSAQIKNLVVSSNSIVFDVTYHDDDGVTEPAGLSVAIFDGDTLVRQTVINGSVDSLSFDNLLNDTEYTLRVLSDYDLRDGHGILQANILAENGFVTLPRIVPEPQIINLNIEENRVFFDIEIEDPDGLIDETSLVVKLYIEDQLVKEVSISSYNVDFQYYDLLSSFEFVIEIEASYDLNDGEGVQENMVIYSETYTTLINEVPSVIVDDVAVTQGYITIDLEVFDQNETLKSALTAILYEGDTEVARTEFGVVATEVILSYLVQFDQTYRLEIIADYNLRDGIGTITEHVLFIDSLASEQPKAPAAELINIVATNESIILDINLMDADNTVEAGSISVYLYLDGNLIATRIIGVAVTNVEFTGLLSNNDYEIYVTADFDLDDGAGLQVNQELVLASIITEEKAVPTAIIPDYGSETESIWFDIDILDPDDVMETGTLQAILYLDGIPTGDTQPLVVGENFAVTFDNVLSNTKYEVEVIVDYDLDDGNLIIEDHDLEQVAIRTVTKSSPRGSISIIESTKESITFNVNIYDDDETIVGQAVALLYIGGTATGDFIDLDPGLNADLSFNGILSDTYYTIRIQTDYYLNDNEPAVLNDLLNYSSTYTIEREVISLDEDGITNVELGKTVIEFDVFIIDDDLVSTTNLQAVLYKGEIATGDTISLSIGANNDEQFTGLLANSVYVIKIETDYNMRDGSIDAHAVLGAHTAVTKPLFLPSAVIVITDEFDTEIVFDVDVADSDDTITDLTTNAVLFLDGAATGDTIALVVGANDGLSFAGLEFGQDYIIKVITDYNLNSGGADIEDAVIDIEAASTHQIVLMTSIVEDKKQIAFELDTDDEFGIMTSQSLFVQLYDLNGVPIGDTITIHSASGVLLLSLYSDNDYSVEISATFDLSDGNGVVTEVVYTYDFHTVALDEPVITINRDPYHFVDNPGGIIVAATTIDLEIEVGGDGDGVITGTLTAYIYADGDGTTVIQSIVLIPGTNNIQFTGLDTVNNSYQILIQADADFNTDGVVSVLYVFDEITFIEGN